MISKTYSMPTVKIDRTKNLLGKLEKFKEVILIIPLSIIIFRIFFSQRRASVFDVVALAVLVIWRYFIAKKPFRRLPKFLIISVFLYMLSDFVGALLSDNRYWELTELRKYVHVFIGGLLFITPMEARTRKILVTLFFIAAAVAGAQGIWQYYKIGMRSEGSLPHAILYAETLALVCGVVIFMLLFHNRNMFESKIGLSFFLTVLFLTFGGILFSESRGVWVALFVASAVTLSLYNRRKTLLFLVCIIAVLSITFYFRVDLRERAKSIITSIYTEDVNSSTGTRTELWKGALLIFKGSPLLGAGTGNFESNIKRLIQERKLKQPLTMVHAHNIFLQALATRGIIGFAILAAIFTALIKWGASEIQSPWRIGGYIIIFSTILTMVGGLTEDNLGTTKYLAAYCFTIGLLAPLGFMKNSGEAIVQNEGKSRN